MANRGKSRLFVRLNTGCIIGFCRLMGVLPVSISRALGRWAGSLAYYIVPRIKQVGLKNLDLAYGDTLSSKEKRRIARSCAESVGITAAEFSRTVTLHKDVVGQFVTFEGLEHLDFSRGLILVGAHLGNWEWMAPALRTVCGKVSEVVQGVSDPRLDQFIDQTRCATGIRTVSKHGAGRELLRLLREGWVVGILVDQSPRDSAVPVEFFGKPCWGTIGPAMLAARAKVPVHSVVMPRDEKGRYTLAFSPPIELADTGDFTKDLVENTQRCQNVVEALVRQHPEQWLWFHRRWKERPRLEAEWAVRRAKRSSSTSAIGNDASHRGPETQDAKSAESREP